MSYILLITIHADPAMPHTMIIIYQLYNRLLKIEVNFHR